MADIGERDAAFAIDYLKRESIRVLAEDLGRDEPCKELFLYADQPGAS
jgi:chemotaxis receptor (MCP) glutamine deamidase CheD